ncbi:MAG: DMT family transporter [Sphingomonadaceae bacterium]|nr:DMT family transporter [Sphingomonadaceae bacterium]
MSETAAPARGSARAFAAVMVANICLAFGPWLVRLADMGSEASAFWRMTLGAPLLLAATAATRQPLPALTRPLLLTLIAAALFFAVDLAAWHIGIHHTRIANASLFGNITSITFSTYGFLAARRWPARNQTIAMLLAVAGVLLLAGRSYELSVANLGGDLMCILAGLAYTGYLVLLERVRGRVAPLPLLALVTIATVPMLGLFALFRGRPILPHDWTPLVLLAIGSQLIGQGLTIYALGELPPVVIGLALMIQPVVGSTIGWLFYDERLTPLDLVGAVAIAAALVLVRRRE